MTILDSFHEVYDFLRSNIWPKIAPIFHRASADTLSRLIEIAGAAIEKVAADPTLLHATSTVKQQTALGLVQDNLKTEPVDGGSAIGTSLINLAIEIALQAYKAKAA